MKKIIIILSVFFILFFVGCGLNSKLEGTKWESVVVDENTNSKIEVTTYEFLPNEKFIIHYVPYLNSEPQYKFAIITTGTWWVDSINELSLASPKIEYPSYKEVESVNYTIEYSKEKLVLSNADETITLTRVK